MNFYLPAIYDDFTYTKTARFDETGIPVGVSSTGEPEGLLTDPMASIKDFFKNKAVFPLYLGNNRHWVAAGHQLVADVLYRNLQPYLSEKLKSRGN